MKNTGKERAALYREFCEWCDTVPYLELDPRLHTHGGRIEDGGYISNIATAKAFAAWQAARRATAAPQPQADARDAECFRFWVSEAARSPAAMAKLIMHCTTEDEYRAAITQCIDARKAAIAAAKGAQK